eukprot:scaffold285_cov304-Pinguiococcus_pyrenoidosus.AAC.16
MQVVLPPLARGAPRQGVGGLRPAAQLALNGDGILASEHRVVRDAEENVGARGDGLDLGHLLPHDGEHQGDPSALGNVLRHARLLEHAEQHDGGHAMQIAMIRVLPQRGQDDVDALRRGNLGALALHVREDREGVARGLDELASLHVRLHGPQDGVDGSGVADLAPVGVVADDERGERVEHEGQELELVTVLRQRLHDAADAAVGSDERLVVLVLADVGQRPAAALEQLGRRRVTLHAGDDDGNAAVAPDHLLDQAVVEGQAPEQVARGLLQAHEVHVQLHDAEDEPDAVARDQQLVGLVSAQDGQHAHVRLEAGRVVDVRLHPLQHFLDAVERRRMAGLHRPALPPACEGPCSARCPATHFQASATAIACACAVPRAARTVAGSWRRAALCSQSWDFKWPPAPVAGPLFFGPWDSQFELGCARLLFALVCERAPARAETAVAARAIRARDRPASADVPGLFRAAESGRRASALVSLHQRAKLPGCGTAAARMVGNTTHYNKLVASIGHGATYAQIASAVDTGDAVR